jgi:EmrB/QacA subfamily drug resistance transporter
MSRTPSKPLVLLALLLASFLINLDTTLVNVALPSLTRELGASTSQLQWVVDAYNLVFAGLLLTSGSLSDRFGRKGMLLAGLTVFGAASFIGGYLTTARELVAARGAMGLGAAMTFPATLSLLTAAFKGRKERALAIGLWGATSGVAIALGPIVGGFLLSRYSWASVFWILGPVSVAVVALVALAVPRGTYVASHRLDVPGLVVSAGFMGLLVYTIIEAPNRGWSSTATTAGFSGSVILLVAFIVTERRAAVPMLDVRLFRNMRFSAASASVTISFFTLFGFIFLITQFFQFIRGYTALSAGVRLLPVATAVAVGSVLGTRLAIRVGTKAIVTAGLLLQATFYFWVASDISPTFSYGVIAIQMVVFGLGMGLTSAPATESIMGAVSQDKAGVSSAINDSTRLLGGTLGVAVIGSVYLSLYRSRLDSTLPAAMPHTIRHVVRDSIGGAYGVVHRLAASPRAATAHAVHQASTSAFDHGLAIGCVVAGAVALGGALMSALFLPAQPPTAGVDAEQVALRELASAND